MATPEGPLQKWNRIAQAIRNTREKHLKRTRVKKKEWMIDEIMTVMDQRRILKNKNSWKYRSLHKTIKRKIKAAKGEWLAGKCSEIEELDKIKDHLNTHRRIKQMTYPGENHNRNSGRLRR